MAGKLDPQLSFDTRRKPRGIGGWRPNAGRKKVAGSISHDERAELKPRFPQHVTLRIMPGAPSLARDFLMRTIRECVRESHKADFRIVEFNVLGNHLHLITEATSKQALARGIQGFNVRVARRVNSALNRSGKLFAHRYHARVLKTPTEVRFALRYVLLNRKHHDAEKRFSKTWFDPYSSAAWFDGWSGPLRISMGWQQELVDLERPNARPQTWLLSVGWRRLGLLRLDEAPA
jgi:REP element-mobilizing transposase RayT